MKNLERQGIDVEFGKPGHELPGTPTAVARAERLERGDGPERGILTGEHPLGGGLPG